MKNQEIEFRASLTKKYIFFIKKTSKNYKSCSGRGLQHVFLLKCEMSYDETGYRPIRLK